MIVSFCLKIQHFCTYAEFKMSTIIYMAHTFLPEKNFDALKSYYFILTPIYCYKIQTILSFFKTTNEPA